jgi:hypothetical protein
MRDQLPAVRVRLLLIGLPFAGGAGLAMYILAGISLPLAILALALAGAGLWVLVLRRTNPPVRAALRCRARIGLVAGVLATVAYDTARYGVVAVFHMSFKPFHVFTLFGELFIGSGHSTTVTTLVGLAYHISNGTFFGVAYALLFRRPSWWTGTLWGVGLEVCMALLYPQWLRIQVMHEFLEVSAVGHVIYGTVLGLVTAAGLGRIDAGSRVAARGDEAAVR